MFQLSMVKESKKERKRNPCLTNGTLNLFFVVGFPHFAKSILEKKKSFKKFFFSEKNSP
jgi:hypothetical protein